jgi:hypothetical protein
MASSRETSLGALSVGCPRMTSGSTAPPLSAASVEEDVPPDGPAEIAGSSAATSLVVTLVAPPSNTSGAGDPPPVAACVVALAAAAVLVTGTPPPPTTLSLGWASMVSWGSTTWAAPATLAPPKGGDLSEDGTLYARGTKLKS